MPSRRLRRQIEPAIRVYWNVLARRNGRDRERAVVAATPTPATTITSPIARPCATLVLIVAVVPEEVAPGTTCLALPPPETGSPVTVCTYWNARETGTAVTVNVPL